ncbi:TIGR02452 family protein [Chitinophaga nivalis]|uniref:TIGR02452 family protein n=1 Tax=Chitinophaga nivalis TaxID=2991709 RepID=A0ABT3IM01_9BACT|nr:TIGR02452 family protein [Chitinophaga nivalis]MCW3465499.1 TIGR02452 family protein [Chitinophaga nivalis]MCW3484810.1 TIGR02452 family protein [Chitinophaga nivalis]
MNRNKRVAIAQETLGIMAMGHYYNRKSRQIDISQALQHTVANTIHYKPEDFEQVYRQRDLLLQTAPAQTTRITVTGESTFAAAYRLIVEEGVQQVCCLNFASAKNPGGGFLGGAQAQEESLARASGLYASLDSKWEMYQINRQYHSCLYTDHMIYSPLVPVFRNDQDELLEEPYQVSVITAPAVNAGVVKNNEPQREKDIAAVMLGRMEKLLSVAIAQGQTTLILGAWGCGVFRNDKADVASWFAHHLRENDLFKQAFSQIVFAVYDTTEKQDTLNIFKHALQ